MVDGIPVLLDDDSAGTVLDQLDYEAVMGIDDSVVREVEREWAAVIAALSLVPTRTLEIGAGTGVLTRAFLANRQVEELVATDVSLPFLRTLADRLAAPEERLSFVVSDANRPHFREGSFDVVIGRSVLHHLLDYPDTLRQCFTVLQPGGAAVFYEPVLEGKTITTLFMSLMLRADEIAGGSERLTDAERSLIERQIRHQMKSTFLPQDRETLARMEDKYIFKIEEMRALGREIGYRAVDFVNDARDLPYWAYLTHACEVVGVSAERVSRFRWIEDEFRATYGTVFPENLASPVGYFVFKR
ncbi:MAG: class I SAM-dependent methyltransferase [Actinomycetota bacterium]